MVLMLLSLMDTTNEIVSTCRVRAANLKYVARVR
jgi:hypothetical protein